MRYVIGSGLILGLTIGFVLSKTSASGPRQKYFTIVGNAQIQCLYMDNQNTLSGCGSGYKIYNATNIMVIEE